MKSFLKFVIWFFSYYKTLKYVQVCYIEYTNIFASSNTENFVSQLNPPFSSRPNLLLPFTNLSNDFLFVNRQEFKLSAIFHRACEYFPHPFLSFFNGEHFGLKRLKIWKHPEEDAAAHFCDSRWKGTYVAQRKVGCPLHAPAARWTFSKKIFSLQTNCIVTRSCLRCCVHMLHHLDDRNCSLSIIKNDFHSSGTLCSISARTCMLTSLCLCTYSNGDPGDRLENSLALTGIF